MADPTRPPFEVPDDLAHLDDAEFRRETLRLIRLAVAHAAKETADLEERVDTDPRMTDDRITKGFRCVEGIVHLERATLLGVPIGSGLYLARRDLACWGSVADPSPGDPGGGPLFGADHNLLDGDVHLDTALGTVVRGDIIRGDSTPAWAKLAKPASGSVLVNDATDVLYRTIPTTRERWIPAGMWSNASITPATYVQVGTDPDVYEAWQMDALGDYTLIHSFAVPSDWRTGGISATVLWANAGASAAGNWRPRIRTIERVDGDSLLTAGTDVVISSATNFAQDVLKITPIGSFLVNSAQRFQRLSFRRNALTDASDTSAATINVLGILLTFTPLY